MTFARIFWTVVFTAALAACSGNLGGGQSTLPGMPASGTNVQQVAPVSATATPVSASNVATLGDNLAAQALPTVMGWGGSIAFPQPESAASAAPNSKATASPSGTAPANLISVGITAGVVDPPDAPQLGPAGSKRRAKHDPGALTPLFFISLLATSDVRLGEYPKIAVDVPRDVATKHRDDTFALALYDPERKEKAYRLAIAERDMSSPLPADLPSPGPSPIATPVPTATPFGMPNGPTAFTPPPVGSGLDSAALPPERVAFKATAATLTLRANRPVVFALYAIPPPPSPAPSTAPPSASSARPSTSPDTGSSPAPAASDSLTSPTPPSAVSTSRPVTYR